MVPVFYFGASRSCDEATGYQPVYQLLTKIIVSSRSRAPEGSVAARRRKSKQRLGDHASSYGCWGTMK